MPVVTCPKCESRYDPKMDKELELLEGGESLKVVCPVCHQWLRLPGKEAIEEPLLPPKILEGLISQAVLIERGRRRGSSAADSTRTRRRNRTEDEDDEPSPSQRRGKRRTVAPQRGVPVWLWVVGGVLLTFCIGVGAVVYYVYRTASENPLVRAVAGVPGLTEENLKKLKLGMSEAEVLAIFGKPNVTREQPGEMLLVPGPAGPGPVTKRTAIWLGKGGGLTAEFHNGILVSAVGQAGDFKYGLIGNGQGGELKVAGTFPNPATEPPNQPLREPLIDGVKATFQPPPVGETTPYVGNSQGGQPKWYVPVNKAVIGIGVRTGDFGGVAVAQVVPLTTSMTGPQYQLAPSGYEVGGLTVRADQFVVAVRPVFWKRDANGRLDPKNTKVGDWMGFPDKPGAREFQLGGDGRKVLGIASREGLVLDGLALVLEKR